MEVFTVCGGGAATAPASLIAGAEGWGGGVSNVDVEVGTGGAAAGTSAGSWIWPSLICLTVLVRAKGRRASIRWVFGGASMFGF